MAKAKVDTSSKSPVKFELITPGGPALTNHTGCMINNTLYVHGGINKKMGTVPLSGLYCLDLDSQSPVWQEKRAAGSPALSHHASVVLEKRYILLVGGWDGKVRTDRVFCYDTSEDRWTFPETSGFPEGAGLSSHTASLMDNGSILVIGREGGARLQRRYGNAWRLSGSIAKGKFVYQDSEINLRLSSRSGHTVHTVGTTIAIIGGRSDNPVELHKVFRTTALPCDTLTKLTTVLKAAKPLPKPPCGRKQHVSVAGAGLVLVHGGDTFDGKSREPVGDLFAVALRPELQWYKLGDSGVRRSGHVCCVQGDRVVIHGGLGARGVVHCDTYQVFVEI